MGGKLKLPAFAFQQLMHDVFVGSLEKSTRGGGCCKRKKIKVESAKDEKAMYLERFSRWKEKA